MIFELGGTYPHFGLQLSERNLRSAFGLVDEFEDLLDLFLSDLEMCGRSLIFEKIKICLELSPTEEPTFLERLQTVRILDGRDLLIVHSAALRSHSVHEFLDLVDISLIYHSNLVDVLSDRFNITLSRTFALVHSKRFGASIHFATRGQLQHFSII